MRRRRIQESVKWCKEHIRVLSTGLRKRTWDAFWGRSSVLSNSAPSWPQLYKGFRKDMDTWFGGPRITALL